MHLNTVRERVDQVSDVDGCDENTVPHSAKIEVSGMCTLKCSFCFNRKMKELGCRQKNMNMDDFKRVISFLNTIDGMSDVGLFYMGESGLNANLPTYYRMLKENGYWTFLTTNGTVKDTILKSIPFVDSLKVSWNYKNADDFARKTGSSAETYEMIRNNICLFYEACHDNGRPLAVSTVLDGDKLEYKEVLEGLRFDEHYWIPLQTQCGTNKSGIGGVVGESEMIRNQMPCWSLFKFLYVDVDLNVRTCCYGHHEKHVLYNVRNVERFYLPNRLKTMRTLHLNGRIPNECAECLGK